MARHVHVGTAPCVALSIPMHEKKMRLCGKTPTSKTDGRDLCAHHWNVRRRLLAVRGGAKP